MPCNLELDTDIQCLLVLVTSVGLSPYTVAPWALHKERGKGLCLQNFWKLQPAAITTEVSTPELPVEVQGLHGQCTGSPGTPHRAALEGMDPAPHWAPTNPPNSTWEHSGQKTVWDGWEICPTSPNARGKAVRKEAATPSASPVHGGQLPTSSWACHRHHGPGPGHPQHCLLSHRAVTQSMPAGSPHYLQQVLQKQPSEVSAVHGPVQTCSKQTPEMQHLAAQQNRANRSSECKGRKEKKIRKKERTTPACIA